ncbi:MAG: aspartate aminotransferase [Gammaproteobacteria bacterium CG11_big_fil_rev_8_21_14_0_20_46_22]|nr:MAG: aspartate aminotransferase [Gammaproteobacteria bacterium CG12_big_fil_rev_8_21_14_0_65_46_12]PIR10802.1 MAG: aspartate aminotransferase [Gammaproteobacteria bacterium CG11_big_fil_rev_8_21_14_0_20_46_22]
MQLSDRATSLKPSATIATAAKARELKAQGIDIISLSIGEPDFSTPEHICHAAIAAVKNEKWHHYPPVDGLAELKQAVQAKFKRENQLDYTLDEILVSAGAKHSIFNALQAVINPSDEVIIPAPYWVSYPDMTQLAGGVPVIIESGLTSGFKITAEQLQKAITPKTRAFFINSPSNPTGSAYTHEELAELGGVLLEHPDIIVISDDIYEHIYWANEPFCNILNACPALKDRTLIINGASKAYAMTGWRIGYMAGPAEIIKEAKKIQSQSTSGICTIAQAAAVAALNGDQTCLAVMREAFKARHDLVTRRINTIDGLSCRPAEGAFYCFFDASDLITQLNLENDLALCDFLIAEARVALVPGTAFGLKNHVRLSYAASEDTLNEAIDRIESAIDNHLKK